MWKKQGESTWKEKSLHIYHYFFLLHCNTHMIKLCFFINDYMIENNKKNDFITFNLLCYIIINHSYIL